MTHFLRKILPQTGLDETVRRFPLSVICAFLAFGSMLFALKSDDLPAFIPLIALCYFWCGAATLFSETRGYGFRKNVAISLLGCAFIFLLFMVQASLSDHAGFIIWLIPCSLLLIMAAPFLNAKNDDAYFWQFNCELWTGVVNAIFAAFALCLGLVAAWASVTYLFGFKFVDGATFYIFSFCAGLVAPLYALFWVPRSFGKGVAGIPQHCRILVNWVLVPLMAVYLVIFYAYFLKIVIEWELPKGMLSSMIAGLGCLGIVIYMMAWPMVREGSRLLKFLHGNFFKLMLVPMFMMGVALSYRIHQYGITEQRYMVLMVLIWFGVISGFFLIKKEVPLKVIPITLIVLMLIASCGPWGAVAVSGQSQARRLENILIRNHILNEAGVITPIQGRISFKDEKDISSILDYMQGKQYRHRLPEQLSDALGGSDGSRSYKRTMGVKAAMTLMGLEYKSKYEKAPDVKDGDPFLINLRNDARRMSAINVHGYRYILKSNISIHENPEQKGKEDIAVRHQEFMRKETVRKYDMVLKSDGKLILTVESYPALVFDLHKYAQSKIADGLKLKVDDMTLVSSNEYLKVELDLKSMGGFVKDGAVRVTRTSGDFIIYFK